MSEENNSVPFLTLEPNAAAAAAEEAAPPVAEAAQEAVEEAPVEKLELENLSEAEQAAVRSFSEKIDILNTEQVMNYGSAAQKNISEFSDAALKTVRTKDLGKVGNMHSPQSPAIEERARPYVRHTVRYRHARQTSIPRERIISDARNAVRDSHVTVYTLYKSLAIL